MSAQSNTHRPTSNNELLDLAARVRLHAEMLDEESLTRPHIDYRTAVAIREALVALIDHRDELSQDDRNRLGEVARYFVLTNDEAGDLDPDGLVDDAQMIRDLCID